MSDVREKVAGARFTERYGAGAWGRASESVRRSWIDSEANTEFCRILEALSTEPTREPEQEEDKQWTEVVTLHQPGGSRYAAAIQIGPTLFTLAPHLYVASAQDEAKHLDHCLKSLVRRRSSPQEGRFTIEEVAAALDEHADYCDETADSSGLSHLGSAGRSCREAARRLRSGQVVPSPQEGDAGEAPSGEKESREVSGRSRQSASPGGRSPVPPFKLPVRVGAHLDGDVRPGWPLEINEGFGRHCIGVIEHRAHADYIASALNAHSQPEKGDG